MLFTKKLSLSISYNGLKDFLNLDNGERIRIEKKLLKLKEDPYQGKPLGYEWFRELKLNGKRIYFLIYDKTQKIGLVAISDKNTQQATIDEIKSKLKEYEELFN